MLGDSGPGEGAPEVAYVTDFGLIKHVQSGGRATPTGDLLGTIDYVAPEQIEGRPVDGRADVYSLGCVAFECLTGRVPFARENDAAVLWAHMKDEPPPASRTFDRSSRSAANESLARAMAKDPEKRFHSCLEFVDSLLRREIDPETHGRADLSPCRRSGGPGEGTWRWPLVAAIGTACLALGALGALAVSRITGDATVSRRGGRSRRGDQDGGVHGRRARPSGPDREHPGCNRAELQGGRGADARFRGERVMSLQAGRWNSFATATRSAIPHMGTYLRRKLGYAGLPVPDPNERIAAQGSCEQNLLPAVEEWVESGRGGHDAIGHTQLSDSDGLVLCYVDARGAHIEWSTTDLSIYAHAYGPNYNKLLNWWKSQSGPVA